MKFYINKNTLVFGGSFGADKTYHTKEFIGFRITIEPQPQPNDKLHARGTTHKITVSSTTGTQMGAAWEYLTYDAGFEGDMPNAPRTWAYSDEGGKGIKQLAKFDADNEGRLMCEILLNGALWVSSEKSRVSVSFALITDKPRDIGSYIHKHGRSFTADTHKLAVADQHIDKIREVYKTIYPMTKRPMTKRMQSFTAYSQWVLVNPLEGEANTAYWFDAGTTRDAGKVVVSMIDQDRAPNPDFTF